MTNWLTFLVFILFSVSSTNADPKPNADAKHSQLASPDRESNVNSVVVGNQMLRTNGGVEKVVEEERGTQAAIDDLGIALKKFWKESGGREAMDDLKIAFQKFWKESGASQAVKDLKRIPRDWWRIKRRERLIKRGADYKTLFKNSVSVQDLKQAGRPETAKLYGQYLQERRITLNNLISSSKKKRWLPMLHKLLVKWNFRNRLLVKARVNANTVDHEGRTKQFEAYKEYLVKELEKVNRLM